MKKKLQATNELKIQRPKRLKLAARESLKRMEEFEKRKERFIAAVRKDKDRRM